MEDHSQPKAGPRKLGRLLAAVIAGVVLVMAVALGAIGWYYSDLVRDGALAIDRTIAAPDLEVAAVKEGEIILRPTARAAAGGPWTKDGIWGLEWEGGYAQIGKINALGSQEVVRQYSPGSHELEAGQLVNLASFAFAGDPRSAHDMPFEEVTYSSDLGRFPAWFVPGTRSTWAIFVHGRGATREEALRILPTVADMGLPSLIITYRNDEGTPASPDGYYHFGESEWRDLEAAVRYATDHGAQEVILYGYSMGGAIVINFLYQSQLAARVQATILDAPILSFDALIDYGAQRRGVPMPVTTIAKAISGFRFDIDWKQRHYISRSGQLKVPILLFHGDDDERVAIKTSDELAKERPDIVTYVRVSGATHVRSWNMDPAAYESAVRTFLRRLVD